MQEAGNGGERQKAETSYHTRVEGQGSRATTSTKNEWRNEPGKEESPSAPLFTFDPSKDEGKKERPGMRWLNVHFM